MLEIYVNSDTVRELFSDLARCLAWASKLGAVAGWKCKWYLTESGAAELDYRPTDVPGRCPGIERERGTAPSFRRPPSSRRGEALWERVEAGAGSLGAASSESAAGSGRLRACGLRLLRC